MFSARIAGWSLFAAAGTLALAGPASAAAVTGTDRISVAADGTQGDGSSILPSVDDAGRFVAFVSDATNLVAGDTNGASDVFVRDTRLGTVELISRGLDGVPANGRAGLPRITADGRYVVYYSTATNVVGEPAPPRATYNIFVHDRRTGAVERIPAGESGGISADISDDGRHVIFESWSTDLVPGVDRSRQLFAYDRQEQTTALVSRAADGGQAETGGGQGRISGNGRYVAFLSDSPDLVAGDTNERDDVFVRDLVAGTTERVSVASGGTQADDRSAGPSISSDGRKVAFSSVAPSLKPGNDHGDHDIFVHDTVTGTTELITRAYDGGAAGFGFSYSPDISPDGTHVAFWSNVWNLVPDDTNWAGDTFLYDLATHDLTRVSVASDGSQASGADSGVVTAGGTHVFYRAAAADLVPGDTNNSEDIFRTSVD